MKRYVSLALVFVLFAAAAVTIAAQASTAGWKQRIDLSTDASDPDPAGEVKFTADASGFHTANPKAAIFYNPSNMASGNYTLKATFTQNQRSSHNNYLGLIFGGKDLAGAGQSYTYFTVAPQNGTWLLKQRTGDQTKELAPKTANDAIVKLDAAGKASNTLEVRVAADKIDYVVNGTVVHSSPKAGTATDGIYGFRVNHALPDVSISALSVTK
jgi:hypothetical protein